MYNYEFMKENKIIAKPNVKEKIEWQIYMMGHNVKSFVNEELNGATDYHIGRVIAGKNNPSPELAREICNKLGFKFDDIWTIDKTTIHKNTKKHIYLKTTKLYVIAIWKNITSKLPIILRI